MENELLLRIKLQELQQEKQGDQRKDNLKLKQGVTQEEIDEYNKQFEDVEIYPDRPRFKIANLKQTLTSKEVEDA